ncbi:hypothetical protein LMTR3_11540 [Bradyrhizobium sp. LMTR 3]|nr:hypothetical protein LMTR3_11540 [Bradyrhizobium sp. LMTR 3]
MLQKLAAVEPVAANRAEEQKADGIDEGNGITVIFESTPGFDLKFESLDLQQSGIELCAVRKLPGGEMQAAVFVPDGKLGVFLNKITAYRDEDTKPTKKGKTRPKNENLVASIADIRLAALQALWTDAPELYPDPQAQATFEVWLRRGADINHVARLRQHAERFGLTVSPLEIAFIDRTIVLVHGTAENLSRSNDILGMIAEVRLAKTAADFFTRMNAIEQQAWVDNLKGRCTPPTDGAPYVCLLDTGLNRGHALLTDVTHDDDLHTYNPNWGVTDVFGHGTPMAGLAVYGDLTEPLASAETVALTHRVESVKFINEADPHARELYGAVTHECVSRVEVKPDRKRIYCMAITASDTRDRGRPSSWSAAIDAMSAGHTDGQRRLVIVSAGNTVRTERGNYPHSNMTDSIHDPAQSWNALTIGGITDKAIVDQSRYAGWEAMAAAGDLSPCSCTSATWTDGRWPIKPDIVLEAGNMARHSDHAEPDYIDDALSLLSTPHDFGGKKPLVTFGDTSAATAIAARMAAMLWAKYPQLSPEAVRALMIHASDWTPAMLARGVDGDGKPDLTTLVRCFGYGTPNLRRLLSSADNSLTLIAQGSIQPFHKDDGDIKTRELKLHELPWPRDVLEQLQDTDVQLRVTLSYFVEPNPGARGWSTKYGYQSHGLRFDVKRATETHGQFQERINKAARDGEPDDAHKETGTWLFKNNHTLSALGSVRSNIWTGKAADLATRGHIAVYPTYGWWNKRPNLNAYEKSCHYALIATITTPATDIYTPVANAINVPVVIET